jgi:hypothetical protein
MASPKIKADALAFFNRVIKLNTILEVNQACNELLDSFFALDRKPKPLGVRTVSGYLSDYKEHFKGFQHENPELNEIVKGTNIQQCIAYELLNLSPEQLEELKEKVNQSSLRKKGFVDNKARDLSNIPKTDINEIIKMSVECLKSEKPTVIACGVINLTGLRIAEQAMPRHKFDDEVGVIEHTMLVVSEYEIAFRGVVKKRKADDALAFYKRPTLVPAQLIVDAQQNYLQSTKVQAISTDPETFKATYYQNINKEYKKIFGKALSTIEAYDDDGVFIEGKENGRPHKARSFYACALRAILRLNRCGSAAITTLVQRSLVHDSDSETQNYLSTFDESLFINPPTEIEISTDLTEYGKMAVSPIIPVKEKVEDVVKTFDIDKFIDGLEVEENLKLIEFLRSGMSETQAILELFKLVRNTKPATITAERATERVNESTPQTVAKTETSKKSVTEKVNEIIEGIMHYNAQEGQDDISKLVIPSHGYINSISTLLYGKTVAPATAKKCLENAEKTIDEGLKALGLSEGVKATLHNQKYHKNTMAEMSAKILEYIEPN